VSSANLSITLTSDEALVLFEWLAESEDAARPEGVAATAEWRVLRSIQGQLQKRLVEPFDPKYAELVKDARDRVTRSA
jgi:hypothetical protein